MSSKISIKNLSKTFGKNQVLKGIDLEIAERESLVIIGGSGSGKSVLIKTIIGLLAPDRGSEIIIDGENFAQEPLYKRTNLVQKFGMLFQGGALFDSLRIWQNVAFSLIQGGMSNEEAREGAKQKLALVGLSEQVLDKYPNELSGGMQKRAALARAIAVDPEIIFFDEPTSGLDPITAQVITDLISSLSKELGATTLTITHDMRCVQQIGNRIAMIYDGKIIWHGSNVELEDSNNSYVDQFIHGKVDGPIALL